MFDLKMINVLDIVEYDCDEEKSQGLMFRDGKYEMVFMLHFHVVLPETFELHHFPYDDPRPQYRHNAPPPRTLDEILGRS